MTTILLAFDKEDISNPQLDQINRLAPAAKLVLTKNYHELEEIAEDIEIAVGWVPIDVILNLPNLRWYQQWAAGTDWLMQYPAAVDKDFTLTTGSGIHPIGITEQIFAYLLAFARGLPQAGIAQRQKRWQPLSSEQLFELAGKTMVLIGLGDIGLRTAQIATAFGLRVIGVDRNPLLITSHVEKIVGPAQRLEVLPHGDIVVVVLPHTRETEHIIGPAEFAQMKPGTYFVNIGRGKTVKESALIEALQSGKLAGAGLDVFETEPLAPDSPLWTMPNVIITAHYAGATPAYQERAMAIFLENLRRFQAGERLHNVVDKHLGY